MQFSERWLRSLVNPPLDTEGLSHLLTMAGLEVEEIEPVAPAFSGIVVARIVEVEQHPNADKLRICRVDAGIGEPSADCLRGAERCDRPCDSVCAGRCAASWVRDQGCKIAGCRIVRNALFGARTGAVARPWGLLELPADAPIGDNIRDYLALDDVSFDQAHTEQGRLPEPRRCRPRGRRTYRRSVCPPACEPVLPTIESRRAIVLDAPEACPRYCGRVISGVDAAARTPDWLRERIERSGIRAISALVDITNYVMLELGQPLHAFDNARLEGAIHVRWPKAGEQLRLLNEQTVVPEQDIPHDCR